MVTRTSGDQTDEKVSATSQKLPIMVFVLGTGADPLVLLRCQNSWVFQVLFSANHIICLGLIKGIGLTYTSFVVL